jgi:hypothetical protein
VVLLAGAPFRGAPSGARAAPSDRITEVYKLHLLLLLYYVLKIQGSS